MNTWRLIVGFAAAGGLVLACSSDPEKSEDDTGTGGNATTTSGNGGSTTTTSSSVTTTSGTGGGSCYNESGALVAPAGSSTEINQGYCSAQEVDDFYAACFAGDMASCTAFQAASPDCFNCILPVDQDGNLDGYSPVLYQSMMFAYVNIYACEAAAAGLPQCGPPVSSLIFCANTACEACENGTPEDDACFNQAANAGGICGDNITIPTECEPLFDVTELSPECAGADFQAIYTSIANYFCGAP